MRVVVIGGSGHIGTFLVPRLVRAGHEVVSITRGTSRAYAEAPEWQHVEHVVADRQAEDAAGTFAGRVADLRPEAVIDLVCFTLESAAALVEGLRGTSAHLVNCGSIWRSGRSAIVPTTEETMTPPFDEYGIEKQRIAEMLKAETAAGGLDTTSLHPGHIVGPGWEPINPLGNVDLAVWQTLAAGRPLPVPGLGAETVHHVHADDVAQAFELAITNRDRAAGEDFNITSAAALSVRGFAHASASWFGQEAHLKHVTWDEFRQATTAEHADKSLEHLDRSPCFSIDKAKSLLGYAPSYSSLDAVRESVAWLIDSGALAVERPLAR
ncbi:NAD-dependent epimerase/dehydratase family protein [Leifsonia shinshuensis]|uniref:NAD-dependent epimerase/dehydratase family protein n=1 Tax=Leifsonia shinshuensis TaxID=150026 RepID=A0A7G6Y751_9MICO|nr:NAD-dependent epimerase/dehydratase family protein [Leifsonia shinshuensis]QNE34316.1 NAD-dependent epimerase/dehydratase family protein [Leifsonia shinshuensis]